MSEKFRLDRKICFQNTFYTKCINVIIDSIGPSIILRSIIGLFIMVPQFDSLMYHLCAELLCACPFTGYTLVHDLYILHACSQRTVLRRTHSHKA